MSDLVGNPEDRFSHDTAYFILQVPCQSWFDDMQDTELLDLIPFFEGLAQVDDVYSVLRSTNVSDSS